MYSKDVNAPINDGLSKLEKSGGIPFHMPGHKRKSQGRVKESGLAGEFKVSGGTQAAIDAVNSIDITEISGYDNLHHPQGMIRESMDLLKSIYHTRESWYLVNGSTAGILASISAVVSPGDKILVGRNCHKSVYNAIRILRLSAVYFYPAISDEYGLCLDYGPVQREELKKILVWEGDIRAVVITSPTYEGVVSDVSAIRKVISEYDDSIPLIVDEAHGAHLIFHEAFPKSAVECGADIVVQSLHKTLPALTQTALLHLCSSRVSAEALFDWLSVYETSSPSYILMASAEEAVLFMVRQRDRVQKYIEDLQLFRKACRPFTCIHLIDEQELPVYGYDMGKLIFVIKRAEVTGSWLFARLRDDWNLELEMAGHNYVLAMTSVMDEDRDYQSLWEGLNAIDQELSAIHGRGAEPCERTIYTTKVLESWECRREWITYLPLVQSEGRIAADYIMIYPPGVPLLVPGEKIVKEMVEKLIFYVYNGYNVLGLSDGRIPVIDHLT